MKAAEIARRSQVVARVQREVTARFAAVTPNNINAVIAFVQRRCRELKAGAR